MSTKYQISGDKGENDVVKKVACPHCKKSLMLLPKNYPLYDLQCTGCSFRVQVKTNNTKPKFKIRGSGWDIIEKVLKAGFTVPPMLANFNWKENGINKQKIIFYPFIPKSHLEKYTLPPTARRANYRMFNYIKLDQLPSCSLFEK